jgi:hypothetical protein
MKLTPWYPVELLPARSGLYDYKHAHGIADGPSRYYFDGIYWREPGDLWLWAIITKPGDQWRGLAKETK